MTPIPRGREGAARPGTRPPLLDRRDAALALVVVLAGQLDVLAPLWVFGTKVVGPRWAVSLTYLLAGAAVALRRTRPGTAFTIMMAALAGQAVTIGTSEGNGSLLPALILSYSVAAHASRRAAITALCAIPVVAGLREIFNPDNTSAAQVVNGIGWDLTLVGVWFLGAYVRTRRQLVAELRQRAADAAAVAVAAERTRIAREMHDVLAHSLSVIVVQAEAAQEALHRRPDLSGRSLTAIQRTGREALVEIRRLVGLLREDDAPREPAAGVAAVEALVERVQAAGLPVELEVHGSVEGLPAAPDLAVYRIVQESLTNTLKHAGASRARVLIDREDDRVSVEIVDDGRGVSPGPRPDAGNGLRGIAERVAALGGTFSADTLGEGGFAVRAVLSLRNPE